MVTKKDYDAIQVEAARSVMLEVVRLLAEYRDDIVVVGGWVPALLIPQDRKRHIGSTDVDLALNHRTLTGPGTRRSAGCWRAGATRRTRSSHSFSGAPSRWATRRSSWKSTSSRGNTREPARPIEPRRCKMFARAKLAAATWPSSSPRQLPSKAAYRAAPGLDHGAHRFDCSLSGDEGYGLGHPPEGEGCLGHLLLRQVVPWRTQSPG